MIDVDGLARLLLNVQRAYLTDRDRFGGRPLQVVQAEAVLDAVAPAVTGTGGYKPAGPLPDPARRLVLLQILIETAAGDRWPQSWEQLVAGACGYGGYGGHPPPAEAEYAAMATRPLGALVTAEPAGRPRLVWPFCPYPHISGRPERLARVPSGWVCGGYGPDNQPCGYAAGPGGRRALPEGTRV